MFFHQWAPWVYFRRHCPHPWRGVQGPSPDIKTGMRYLNHTDSAKQRWLWANSWKIKSLNDSVTGWMGPPIQLIKIRIMAIFVQWYQYHGPASSSARPGYQPTPCFHKNGPRWALRCWTTIKSCTNFHVWVINMRIIVYHGDYLCVSILFLFAPRPYSWIWIAAARSLVYKCVIVTLVLLWSLLPHISILRP